MRIITALAAMFAATFAAGPALAACPPPAQMQAAATGRVPGPVEPAAAPDLPPILIPTATA